MHARNEMDRGDRGSLPGRLQIAGDRLFNRLGDGDLGRRRVLAAGSDTGCSGEHKGYAGEFSAGHEQSQVIFSANAELPRKLKS